MMNPPPNWYPDPQIHNHLRWWDGVKWTHHVVAYPLAPEESNDPFFLPLTSEFPEQEEPHSSFRWPYENEPEQETSTEYRHSFSKPARVLIMIAALLILIPMLSIISTAFS